MCNIWWTDGRDDSVEYTIDGSHERGIVLQIKWWGWYESIECFCATDKGRRCEMSIVEVL